ncbi:MAG: glycosyltransferase 87 family protein [Gaiellales bacterium]
MLLAAAVLLAAPASAATAPQPKFTPAQAIAIAASDPAIGPLRTRYPESSFTARFVPADRTWRVRLVGRGGHPVLASFAIVDGLGTVLTRSVSSAGPPRLTASRAATIAVHQPAVEAWLSQYRTTTHTATLGDNRVWTVTWSAGGDQVAEVQLPDSTGRPTSVWTGPQVGWMMTRGLKDAYGRKVVDPWVLIPMCLIFLCGLMDWRRVISLHTLDLLMLLSFVVSLGFFDQGDIFISTPLQYPPMLYLAGRMIWIARDRAPRSLHVGERHMLVLIGLIFALMGFRLGLNNQNSNVIDVGYAGVVGASRLLHGEVPYGHFPQPQGTACGGTYNNGDPIGYVQPDHRCESPIGNGDTYGPTVYLAYVPAVAAFGWSGRWDSLPAAHVAASAFDILAVVGLFVAGWRLRSPRAGVVMAFAWAANPFTAYTLNMNANDALVGAAVAWLMAALSLPAVRGGMLAVAGFTKLGPLVMVPVFAGLRHRRATFIGFAVGTALLLSMLLFERHGLRVFWDRTLAYQADRVTPMSIWTLPNYHPGWPHLEGVQKMAQIAVAIGIGLLAFLPRRRNRDAVAVAALCGAAMLGAQLVASYWFYPYVCWWLPAVLVALFLPRDPAPEEVPVPLARGLTTAFRRRQVLAGGQVTTGGQANG